FSIPLLNASLSRAPLLANNSKHFPFSKKGSFRCNTAFFILSDVGLVFIPGTGFNCLPLYSPSIIRIHCPLYHWISFILKNIKRFSNFLKHFLLKKTLLQK